MASAPRVRYSNPAPTGGVFRAARTAGMQGRSLDTASNRRLKLNEALTKFKSLVGGK
jgi:hypothetical protein